MLCHMDMLDRDLFCLCGSAACRFGWHPILRLKQLARAIIVAVSLCVSSHIYTALTRSLTHSLTHSLHSLTHSLTHCTVPVLLAMVNNVYVFPAMSFGVSVAVGLVLLQVSVHFVFFGGFV